MTLPSWRIARRAPSHEYHTASGDGHASGASYSGSAPLTKAAAMPRRLCSTTSAGLVRSDASWGI